MKKFFLLAVVFLILISPTVTKAAADWIWVASDDKVSIWIDNNSIGRDSNGFFAYFKWTFSDEGINRQIEGRRSAGLILDSNSRNDFEWRRVIPDTFGEAEYDAAWARVRGK